MRKPNLAQRPRKGLLLITDYASKRSGWVAAIVGERTYKNRTTTTRAIDKSFDGVSVIVMTNTDTETSMWAAIIAARDSLLAANATKFPSKGMTFWVVFAPSHGSEEGVLEWSTGRGKASALNGQATNVILGAITNGFNKIHFHTCCVGASICALPKATSAGGLGVTVTSFKREILWSSKGPSMADRYVLSGFKRIAAPILDTLRCCVAVGSMGLQNATEPFLQGRKPLGATWKKRKLESE